jgi:hypothetical protein
VGWLSQFIGPFQGREHYKLTPSKVEDPDGRVCAGWEGLGFLQKLGDRYLSDYIRRERMHREGRVAWHHGNDLRIGEEIEDTFFIMLVELGKGEAEVPDVRVCARSARRLSTKTQLRWMKFVAPLCVMPCSWRKAKPWMTWRKCAEEQCSLTSLSLNGATTSVTRHSWNPFGPSMMTVS